MNFNRAAVIDLLLSRALSAVVVAIAMTFGASAQSPILQIDSGGHRATIKDIALTSDGRRLVSAGDDKVIRVWNLSTNKTERMIRGFSGPGHSGKYFTIELSPNAKLLAAAGWMDEADVFEPCCGDIRIFDFGTGKQLALLKEHTNSVYDVSFSPDGKLLVSGGADGRAVVWDVANWRPVFSVDAHMQRISKVDFTADGSAIITAGFDGRVARWAIGKTDPKWRLAAHDVRIHAMALSPTADLVATGDANGVIKLHRISDGKAVRTLARQNYGIGSLAFSPDGKSIVSSCGFNCLDGQGSRVFDLATGKQRTYYQGHDDLVRASAFTSDGKRVITAGGHNHEIHIWDAASGKRHAKLGGAGSSVHAVGITPDRRMIAWGRSDPCPKAIVCPLELGALSRQMRLPDTDVSLEPPQDIAIDAARFRRAQLTHADLSLRIRKGGIYGRPDAILEVVKSGRVKQRIERDIESGSGHSAFSFHPARGDVVFSGGDHGVLDRLNVPDEEAEQSFIGHEGPVFALATSADARILISGSADQTVRIWNAGNGELIVSIFEDAGGDWVMWTPQGYYHSSPNGDRLIGWQINQGFDKEARYISARQMKKHLHSPEIVRRALLLANAAQAAKDLRGTDTELQKLLARVPPVLEVLSPDNGSELIERFATIKVQLDAAPDAAKRLKVIVNERNVSRSVSRTALSHEGGTAVAGQFEIKVPLRKGRNDIHLSATDDAGFYSERHLVIDSTLDEVTFSRGRLLVAAIGVNDYPKMPPVCAGPAGSCQLSFAVADARRFTEIVSSNVKPLFTEMKTLLLVNKGEHEPTADNISDKLEEFFADAKPEDTVMLFLAGHGVNIGEDYYFLSTDAHMRKSGRYRKSSIVRWNVLSDVLEEAEGTRMMFVDTCHAANAYNASLKKKAGDGRIIVFSATRANSVSQELAEHGHGVFTYALVRGISGEADSNSDQAVRVLELGSTTSNMVRKLTNQEQTPVFYMSGLEDFIIAQP